MANVPLKSITFPGLSDTYTVPQLDDTLAVAGKAADAKAAGDQISDLKSALDYNINAVTVSTGTYSFVPSMIDGSYAKSNTGVITEDATYKRTDYMPTFGGTTLTMSSSMTALCWYNKEKVFLSGTTSNTNLTKDIPAGAYYWILSLKTTKDVPTITIANAVPVQVADRANALSHSHQIAKNAIVGEQFPGNLVDPLDWEDNSYINASNGSVARNAPNYFCTGYIPVVAGTSYKPNLGRTYAWYDSSKAYISGVAGAAIQQGVTAPENAAFIRFSASKLSKANNGDGISDPSGLYFAATSDFSLKTVIKGLDWCVGKKVCWLGDSILTGAFDENVCAAMGMTKLTTDGANGDGGIGGSTIALKEDGTDGRNAICIRYADMPNDADIIAVHCGTNDFQYNWSPIGTIDSTENTTFYGALKTLCEGLIRKYPHKLIFFTTPIPRMQPFYSEAGGTYTEDYAVTTPLSKNGRGKTLGDYADIIKEVCGMYSIPVLDLYRESGLNACIDYARYVADNTAEIAYKVETKTVGGNTFTYFTHPNTLGDKILARRIAGWMTQLSYDIE